MDGDDGGHDDIGQNGSVGNSQDKQNSDDYDGSVNDADDVEGGAPVMMMVVMLLTVTMMLVMAMVPTEMSGQTEAEEDLVKMCKKNSKPHRQRLCLCRRWGGDPKRNPHFLLFAKHFQKT